jgi:hypothetical protein
MALFLDIDLLHDLLHHVVIGHNRFGPLVHEEVLEALVLIVVEKMEECLRDVEVTFLELRILTPHVEQGGET